jgi:phosphatidate cytidylyltransferase
MGALLIVLVLGMLVLDRHLAPWFPFLLLFVLGLGLAACFELLHLLDAARRPSPGLCYLGVAVLVAVNWLGQVPNLNGHPWLWLVSAFTAVLLAAFLVEMATFREPGASVVRIALAGWVVGYLGLLPSFFAQLRWLGNLDQSTAALALTIFVPKGSDIGAYFTGRLVGRHRMTPVLSPKKTWEGAAGGLTAAVAVAIGLDHWGPADVLHGHLGMEVGFGLTVGVAGMLGDLAESLIKRDCRQKDASQAVPGFGGVLDVVDAVLFAAPVAYGWLWVTIGNT